MRRTALQQLKQDDPLVQQLVKILHKVNRVAGALQDNLGQQTRHEADYLAQAAKETAEAYQTDWEWYGVAMNDLLGISNNLQELDEQAEHWIEFLNDQYNVAMELDLKATELNYPDDHLVFQFVDKIEEALNLEI